MVDMTRWLDLVECEVAPVGSNFIPQELTRQRPVVDHCVPGSGDGDYDMDIGQTANTIANGDGFLYIQRFVEAWLVAAEEIYQMLLSILRAKCPSFCQCR